MLVIAVGVKTVGGDSSRLESPATVEFVVEGASDRGYTEPNFGGRGVSAWPFQKRIVMKTENSLV